MIGASERANGQASGPVLTSRFLADLNHCGKEAEAERGGEEEPKEGGREEKEKE